MEWYAAARQWSRDARGRLFSAPATPFDRSGTARPEFALDYFRALVSHGADGLAIAAHTGRGPYLSAPVRADLVRMARQAGASVVVGVKNGDEARSAADAGAGAALVFPVPGDTDSALRHIDQLWEVGRLPLIAFDLYTAPYSDATFAAVVEHPAVAAVKLARLSDAVACQDRIALVRDCGKLAITGEDRMFGASLTWGAEAALVGIAAAAVSLTRSVLDTFAGRDMSAFLEATRKLDEFAAATFREPFDGYVQRMTWVAGAEGLLPRHLLTDPYAPVLPDDERDRVLEVHSRLTIGQLPTRAS
ncbi:dihydrodipicolinate synthase family protein [Nocardia sp. NPDC049707]|uniref:dihydrodipicolinate synthase family protein n=1 Tax=Nocardia sp. NPDC049707 TaxID=3154735 RepID=UPI0034132A51